MRHRRDPGIRKEISDRETQAEEEAGQEFKMSIVNILKKIRKDWETRSRDKQL